MLLQEEWDKITMEEIRARIAKIPRRKIPANSGHQKSIAAMHFAIPSVGKMGPTVIDKSQPIESIGSSVLLFAHGLTFVEITMSLLGTSDHHPDELTTINNLQQLLHINADSHFDILLTSSVTSILSSRVDLSLR